jgi:hypothetical protein
MFHSTIAATIRPSQKVPLKRYKNGKNKEEKTGNTG